MKWSADYNQEASIVEAEVLSVPFILKEATQSQLPV